jgi:hypothetical protein
MLTDGRTDRQTDGTDEANWRFSRLKRTRLKKTEQPHNNNFARNPRRLKTTPHL